MEYRTSPSGKRALRQMGIHAPEAITYENLIRGRNFDGIIRFTAAEGENPLFRLRTRKGKHLAIKVFPDQRYEDGIEHFDALTGVEAALKKAQLPHAAAKPLFATRHLIGMSYIPKRVRRFDEFVKKADKRTREKVERELRKVIKAVEEHAPHLLARFDPHEENVFVQQQRRRLKLIVIDALKVKVL